jgi:hypothetical protein
VSPTEPKENGMSGQIVHLDADPHAAVQKLLPWYLTGRLEDAERAQVDEHLANCAECRAELETERAWQLLQPVDGAHVDVEQGWADMRALLGGEAPRAPGRPLPRTRRERFLPGFLAQRPMARAWAAPALLSVALACAIAYTLRPQPPVDYHALAAAPAEGATAVVRFRPDATEAQIRRSLNESGARLVDGPTVTDAYVVRLPRDRYTEGLAKLRRQPGVALVEALETATPP